MLSAWACPCGSSSRCLCCCQVGTQLCMLACSIGTPRLPACTVMPAAGTPRRHDRLGDVAAVGARGRAAAPAQLRPAARNAHDDARRARAHRASGGRLPSISSSACVAVQAADTRAAARISDAGVLVAAKAKAGYQYDQAASFFPFLCHQQRRVLRGVLRSRMLLLLAHRCVCVVRCIVLRSTGSML